MEIIAHRINTAELLKQTPTEYGVEVDIRSTKDNLIIHHDPFSDGENFTAWIKNYKHGTLILNVKEEGLEDRLIHLMQENSIEDYFFLDQSFPFLYKFSKACKKRSAVRISEFESIETANRLLDIADWVWVDSFKKFSFTSDDMKQLKDKGYRLCLVSPELQGRSPDDEIQHITSSINDLNSCFDAVCTKRPDLWLKV